MEVELKRMRELEEFLKGNQNIYKEKMLTLQQKAEHMRHAMLGKKIVLGRKENQDLVQEKEAEEQFREVKRKKKRLSSKNEEESR